MPAIDIDRETAREAAQRELEKPIYPKESIPQRIQEWIHELLYRIVEKGSSVPGGWLTLTVLAILLVVAFVVAVRIGRRTIRTRAGGETPLFDAGQLTAAQHRAIAQDAADKGEWAAAIRHRLRAVARSLEEHGILDPSPGRTATELAAVAGDRIPALVVELSAAATTFNDVTYGEQPGTPSAYQMIVDLDDHVRHGSAAGRFDLLAPQRTEFWTPVR